MMDHHQFQNIVKDTQQQTHRSMAMVHYDSFDLRFIVASLSSITYIFFAEPGERNSQDEAADQ